MTLRCAAMFSRWRRWRRHLRAFDRRRDALTSGGSDDFQRPKNAGHRGGASAGGMLRHHALVGGADGGAQRHDTRRRRRWRSFAGPIGFPSTLTSRRRGHSVEDAQDLTQEFFARVLEHHWLARADQAKGRFRTFLLTAMERFLANEWDKVRALKRGGGRGTSRSNWIRRRRATGWSRRTPGRRSRPSNTAGR